MAEDKETQEDSKTSLATEIVKKLPLDETKPVVQELSILLTTVGMALNYPFRGMRRKMIQKRLEDNQFLDKLSPKIERIPEDQRKLPPAQTVAEVVEGVLLCEDAPSLQEMYLNLLAASMNSDTADMARAAFAQTLRQMSPDEARIMHLFSERSALPIIDVVEIDQWLQDAIEMERLHVSNFGTLGIDAECQSPKNTAFYVDNLIRMGLIDKQHYVPSPRSYYGESDLIQEFKNICYSDDLHIMLGETDQNIQEYKRRHFGTETSNVTPDNIKYYYREDILNRANLRVRQFVLTLTLFGRGFCQVCLPMEDLSTEDTRLSPTWQPNTDVRDMTHRIAEDVTSTAIQRELDQAILRLGVL